MFGGGGGGGGGGRSSGSGSSSGVVGGGGGGGECQNPGGSSSSFPHHHHHHHPMSMNIDMSTLLPLQPFQPQLVSPAASMGGGVGSYDEGEFPTRDDRVAQWGIQETKDFIAIRAGLEGEFAVSKRNKALWEIVADRMKDLGYRRTPDQCKCKWKNLVNRYKGRDVFDLEDANQFPFFDELHALFTAKANDLRLSQVDFEGGSMQSSKKARKVNRDGSPEEFLENDNVGNQSDEDGASRDRTTKKRNAKGKQPQTLPSGKAPRQSQTVNLGNNESSLGAIPEMLRNFFQQQQKIEMQWRESMEKFAHERELSEHEWRQTMERLERERMMMEKAWREREEQRKAREESRAEKRDALLTTLLNKLLQDKDV